MQLRNNCQNICAGKCALIRLLGFLLPLITNLVPQYRPFCLHTPKKKLKKSLRTKKKNSLRPFFLFTQGSSFPYLPIITPFLSLVFIILHLPPHYTVVFIYLSHRPNLACCPGGVTIKINLSIYLHLKSRDIAIQ